MSEIQLRRRRFLSDAKQRRRFPSEQDPKSFLSRDFCFSSLFSMIRQGFVWDHFFIFGFFFFFSSSSKKLRY